MDYTALAGNISAGATLDASTAVAILDAPDSELLDLVAAAGALRREHYGNYVKLNYLVNLKSGLCQENCSYCSQALGSRACLLYVRRFHLRACMHGYRDDSTSGPVRRAV
ncbi:hypothetical protein ACFQRD_16510, partial [Brachybacterium sp. GCM10030268]